MLPARRVVVTGMGTVNPIGKSVNEFWENCCKGVSGVKVVSDFAIADSQSQIAGVVEDFDFWEYFPQNDLLGVDRSCIFALVAAKEALESAGLGESFLKSLSPGKCRLLMSTAAAQIASMEKDFLASLGDETLALHRPRATPGVVHFNATAKTLANQFGIPGECLTVTTGCTGALDAMGYAMDLIRLGKMDLAVVGGAEAPITPICMAAFSKIGATTSRNAEPQKASRPFDMGRDGFVLAEGSGMLVIEALDHALLRGAPIFAELGGYGSLNNFYHMTKMPENGLQLAQSARTAIEDAGISPDEIDSINAHGSSTPQNDIAEANAYWRLFQERTPTIPVTCIKSHIGHTLAASSAIEVIASIMSMRTGIVPPTINLVKQDSRCMLDVVADEPRRASVRCTLKTSSGFSGIHSSLVIRKFEHRN
ncbi:beta-ketoacyl-[acyl-carrier-protein] synthase family protein [Gloeobacter violaceus]|nr:beta-ketoacyl-[acyl-carrier-protein] synthase family protein [Gloeobacter violaceus]